MTAFLSIIFLIVVLVFVHELGHFLAAKVLGMRVDEFSVGFKPALWQKKYGETNYVLGLIPLGGYVKIWGDNNPNAQSDPRAFSNKSHGAQAVVLIMGVVFNILLAWLVLSFLFARGIEVNQASYSSAVLTDKHVQVLQVIADSPAEQAGIEVRDRIVTVAHGIGATNQTAEEMIDLIAIDQSQILEIEINKPHGETRIVTLETHAYEDRYVAGFVIDNIGTLRLPVGQALAEGAVRTAQSTKQVVVGITGVISGLFAVDSQSLEGLAGPVGIANIAGDAFSSSSNDFMWLLALLSINLAVFNLLPIPALDGGRLLFVAIEFVTKKRIPYKWFLYVNAAGFILLLSLMLTVTVGDIIKL